MANPSLISPDTELSAVNTILGAIGQAPVSSLDYDAATDTGAFENPEIGLIYNLLREANMDVQNEGWVFNTEDHIKYTPDADGFIQVPDNVLRMDITESTDKNFDPIKRNGRLYNKVNHSDVFENDVFVNQVTLIEFTDLPPVFQRWVTYKAATRAAAQLVANTGLVQIMAAKEGEAKANCIEYECNQGDYNYMGFPHETHFTTYKPYRGLRR
tara:strand:- start:492 stop:1130 length:639 start_codon:yes stop_codon:yes gene_type:complete